MNNYTPPEHNPSQPPPEDTLHAYVDGHLPAPALAAVELALAQDPAAAAKVAVWRAQRAQLRALYEPMNNEAVPPALLNAAKGLQTRQQTVQRWSRWGGMAASLVLVFGLGWFSSTAWRATTSGSGAAGIQARGPQEFVRQAALAYAVYSPEVRHPVEVAAAQQEHLVQWLSKRLGRPLKVPSLSAQGYELVGGRLLPGEGGARAQFMFQDGQGERVTLYLGAVNPQAAPKDPVQQTAFQFSSEAGVSSFYWVDKGFGYALAGKLPREGLLKLAEAVYPQL
jgi:anti-sigma factor RsiW